MNDERTRLSELREIVRRFVHERDWEQFHTPKNLAMSLAIEAAELMEHFQWLTAEESASVAQNPARLSAVGEEMADVLCYLIALANALDLDLSSTLADKMAKNAVKYPAHEYRGRYGPEDEGGQVRTALPKK
jgi:NTP pyrophosphatase (non-canonical NTP hydrolase)